MPLHRTRSKFKRHRLGSLSHPLKDQNLEGNLHHHRGLQKSQIWEARISRLLVWSKRPSCRMPQNRSQKGRHQLLPTSHLQWVLKMRTHSGWSNRLKKRIRSWSRPSRTLRSHTSASPGCSQKPTKSSRRASWMNQRGQWHSHRLMCTASLQDLPMLALARPIRRKKKRFRLWQARSSLWKLDRDSQTSNRSRCTAKILSSTNLRKIWLRIKSTRSSTLKRA